MGYNGLKSNPMSNSSQLYGFSPLFVIHSLILSEKKTKPLITFSTLSTPLFLSIWIYLISILHPNTIQSLSWQYIMSNSLEDDLLKGTEFIALVIISPHFKLLRSLFQIQFVGLGHDLEGMNGVHNHVTTEQMTRWLDIFSRDHALNFGRSTFGHGGHHGRTRAASTWILIHGCDTHELKQTFAHILVLRSEPVCILNWPTMNSNWIEPN